MLNTDLASASELLDELLQERPNNFDVHVLDFHRHRMLNSHEGVENAVLNIEANERATPDWANDYLKALQTNEVEIRGVVILFDKQIIQPRTLFALTTGNYEGEEAKIGLEKIEPSDSVLELGAGIGYMSSLLKSKFSEIPLVCFEANPTIFEHAQKNHFRNNVQVKMINAVLGLTRGTVDFYLNPVFTGSSLISFEGAERKITVEQYPVNDALQKYKPNFVIMDIEGGEKDLIPAMNWNGINKLLVELHPNHMSNREYSAILQALLNEGFIMDMSTAKNQVFYFYKPNPTD